MSSNVITLPLRPRLALVPAPRALPAPPTTPSELMARPGLRPLGVCVADALRPFMHPGQRLIWRVGPRWLTDDGSWTARFDGLTAEELAEAFDYDIVVDCGVAAIVAQKAR